MKDSSGLTTEGKEFEYMALCVKFHGWLRLCNRESFFFVFFNLALVSLQNLVSQKQKRRFSPPPPIFVLHSLTHCRNSSQLIIIQAAKKKNQVLNAIDHTIGYVRPTPSLQNSHPGDTRENGKVLERQGFFSKESRKRRLRNSHNLQPDLIRLLLLSTPADKALLTTSVADLVGADPFAFDGPGAEALVVRIVAGEVAVLDQTAAGVSAGEVDDFELVPRA